MKNPCSRYVIGKRNYFYNTIDILKATQRVQVLYLMHCSRVCLLTVAITLMPAENTLITVETSEAAVLTSL